MQTDEHKMNVELTHHPSYLDVVVQGSFDFEQAKSQFPSVLSLCKQHGYTRLLIDFSKIVDEISATHRMIIGLSGSQFYLEEFKTGKEPFKIAFVATGHYLKYYPEPYTPAADVLRETGMHVLVTHDPAEAKNWLHDDQL